MAIRLDVRGLTVELPTEAGWIRPVNDVSFTLGEGETLGIVGESGSGKTMLALALMGLEPPGARVTGEAWLQRGAGFGQDVEKTAGSSPPTATRNDKQYIYPQTAQSLGESERNAGKTAGSSPLSATRNDKRRDFSQIVQPRGESSDGHRGATNPSRANLIAATPSQMRSIRGREIAMIFQEPMTALNPVMRIGAQVEESIHVHEPGAAAGEIRRRALESLDRASVPDVPRRARQYPHQLSGGLRQRVMIAMALAAGPRVLIADEPTTALDVTVQKQILELLAKLRRELGLSLLFITHDLGVVAQVADRVAVMYAGRVVEEGPASEVLRRPRHPYTEGLLRAAPRLTREKLVPIPGTVPSLDALPPGCSFGPRCALHVARCDDAMPDLRLASPEHNARCILVP
ncbi:MAG: ABC transporter ATP-binding protein [Candidatus Acidiferrales bacterium]